MSQSEYNNLLDIVAPLLAVMFWLVFWLLHIEARDHRQVMTITRLWRTWVAHAAIMWTANAIYRLFFIYEGPTLLFSLWIVVIFLHAGFSFLWRWWVLKQYPVYPLTLPEDWDGIDND